MRRTNDARKSNVRRWGGPGESLGEDIHEWSEQWEIFTSCVVMCSDTNLSDSTEEMRRSRGKDNDVVIVFFSALIFSCSPPPRLSLISLGSHFALVFYAANQPPSFPSTFFPAAPPGSWALLFQVFWCEKALTWILFAVVPSDIYHLLHLY